MKKILCAVLALAAMASCSKEYIVAENKQAIAFGEAFVDNGTRADYSTDKEVSQFLVYGTVKGKYAENAPIAYIFDGDLVKNTDGTNTVGYGGVWFCDNIQYWVPNANYNFTAVVDGALTADHSKINFTVADGDEGNLDLLYATAAASVAEDGTVTGTGLTATNGLVKFQFAHLLSKLQFAAPTHNFGSAYSVKVTEIKVANVVDKGVYSVGGGTWAKDTNATTDVVLDFCDAVDTFKSRQILPLNQELTVTINYEVYFTKGDTTTKISQVTKTGTIPAQDYVKGFVYVITPNITANQIKFTVTGVDGWTTGSGITL